MINTILGTTVVVLIIATFSIFFAPQKRIKNRIEFDQTVKTINLTKDTSLDTIINLTAQILRVKNVTVVCVPIDDLEEAETYFAYIQGLEGYYLIKVHPNLSEDLLVESIVHECVHLSQSESGRLKRLEYGFWFEGKVYGFNTPYYLRPYEQEAYNLEFYLKYAVKDLLYKDNPLDQ